MLIPGRTLNASLQVVGVGSIWEAFSSKRGVLPLWGSLEECRDYSVLGCGSCPEEKGESVLQLKGSTVAECP